MRLWPLLIVFFEFIHCGQGKKLVITAKTYQFTQPVKVQINGYKGNAMEPFLLRDGKTLLFNNLNGSSENTDLHWASKLNDSTFIYKGKLSGVNINYLEAVPTVDNEGNLYFVSTRSYNNTLSTLYQGRYINGTVTNVHLIKGISKFKAGWVNFDVEVSADGEYIYFVDAQLDRSAAPLSADLVIAKKISGGFVRLPNSGDLLKNINTGGLEYGACISADQLTLFFTRVSLPLTKSSHPSIFMAIRTGINNVFKRPLAIASITGFAEAPTIAPDQKTIYYHKKENGKFVLYMVKKW